ncbi:MAG: hypothetical protein JSR41_22165 [Proteobacteria bacterium]|nr:hypothetical protein [Pseudomonadota bacterium]
MTAWQWGASVVARAYDVLCAQGSLGCYAMVIAAMRLAAWGVQLTDGRRPPGVLESRETQMPMWLRKAVSRRYERATGYALQVGGAVLVALAAVALARVLAEG